MSALKPTAPAKRKPANVCSDPFAPEPQIRPARPSQEEAFFDGMRALLQANPEMLNKLLPPKQVTPMPARVTEKREQLLDLLGDAINKTLGVGQRFTWQLLVRAALAGDVEMHTILDKLQRRLGGTPGMLDPSTLGKLFKVDYPARRETAKWRFVFVEQTAQRIIWKLERK